MLMCSAVRCRSELSCLCMPRQNDMYELCSCFSAPLLLSLRHNLPVASRQLAYPAPDCLRHPFLPTHS